MSVRINGEELPEAAILMELQRLIQFYKDHLSKAEIGRRMPQLMRAARDQAIGARLLRDEANALKIAVNEGEVEKSYQAMLKQAGNELNLKALAAKQGLTMEALRDSIRTGKRLDALVASVTAKAAAPTGDEIKAWFEAHQADYRTPDRVQVRHILVKPATSSEADKATTHSRLLDLKHRLETGADFADLAAAHSECPSGRKTGGSLGWIERGATLPAFDTTVFAMPDGALSEIVETPLGHHLIHKLDSESGRPMTLDEARERIGDLLLHQRRGQTLTAHVRRLREAVAIEDDDDPTAADAAASANTEI